MWNAWVLWVFALPHASNFIMETEYSSIAYRASSTIHSSFKMELLCQYKMIFWQYIVTKSSIIDDLRVRVMITEIRLWFVCFLCKTLPKRLKFNKVDIYMFKIKQNSTITRCDIGPMLTIRHQNEDNIVVLVYLC